MSTSVAEESQNHVWTVVSLSSWTLHKDIVLNRGFEIPSCIQCSCTVVPESDFLLELIEG